MTTNTQRLHSQICTHFEPYRQFFLEESIAEIVPPNPSFKPILNSKVRDNLNIPRQMMYLKNIVPHDLCEGVIEEQLSQPHEQFKMKRGLISAHHKGFLYWSFHTRLMRFKVSEILSKEKNNNARQNWIATQTRGTELININESILELKIHADKLYLRCSRQIVVIDSQKFTILTRWKLQSEILGFSIEQHDIIICNEQQGKSILSQTTKDGKLDAFSSINGTVNSFWNFTDNQLIFCLRNSIDILDRRTKDVQNLYHFGFNHSNRIYSASPLKNAYWGSQYLVAMQSYSACIYDLRKCSEPVTHIKHYCEQSPPSVLQLYSGHQPDFTSAQRPSIDTLNLFLEQFNKRQQKSLLRNPLLVATSPYEAGSSIFAELSSECFSTPHSSLQSKSKFFNKFQLLFDSGKIHVNSHPLSVTPLLLESEIAFFHMDCYYGIHLQIFDRKIDHSDSKKKQTRESQGYQRINFARAHGIQKSMDPNQAWFLQNTMEQQLDRPNCNYWQKIMEEDDDLLLEANCYQKRHLRYANLQQFYQKLDEQSKTKKVKNMSEKEAKLIIEHIHQQKIRHLNDQQKTQPFTQNQRMYDHAGSRQTLLDEDLEQLSLDWNTAD